MTAPAITIEEADVILQQLGQTEHEWADGGALYGPGGLFNDLRKSYLSAKAMEIRDSMSGAKSTESLIDQKAHCDGEYEAFLDRHLIARATWLALDAKRQRHWMKLKIIAARAFDARRFGA